MKNMINEEIIQGRVFSCDLAEKVVKNEKSNDFGKNYINGKLNIAVDEEGLNVIPVDFIYVKPETAKGNPNRTYAALKQIMNGKTWETDGKDEATKVKVTASLGVNDFVSKNDNKIVSAKVNSGSFVNIVSSLPSVESTERNKFTVDILITKATRIEADPEKRIDKDYMKIHGAVFDFRKTLMPVDLIVKNEKGIESFESMDISNSNPVFLKVWGQINCETKEIVKEEESSWGENCVTTFTSNSKEWVVTGVSALPYEFGDEAVLTVDELKKLTQDREVHLAEVQKNHDDWANKNALNNITPKSVDDAPGVSVSADTEFKF